MIRLYNPVIISERSLFSCIYKMWNPSFKTEEITTLQTITITNRPTSTTTTTSTTTQKVPNRVYRYPCHCFEGECGCCSGAILANFNINVQNRACVNVTYFPEDFEFHMRLIMNDVIFYQRRMSGRYLYFSFIHYLYLDQYVENINLIMDSIAILLIRINFHFRKKSSAIMRFYSVYYIGKNVRGF